MTLTEYPDLEQRSPEWYAARCGIVTASAVGALLTPKLAVADNDGARGLTALLVAERITGEVDETPITSDMWRGIEHEPYALDEYAEHYSPVTPMGFMRREGKDWTLGYSPDGLVGGSGLVEVKCPRAKTHVRTILADAVPPQHMAQLQAGMLVSGRMWCDFISYVAGMPLFVKRVFPDAQWFSGITAACRAFESSAGQMVYDYTARAARMPQTQRLDFEIKVA
jgi:hypothetical protein